MSTLGIFFPKLLLKTFLNIYKIKNENICLVVDLCV